MNRLAVFIVSIFCIYIAPSLVDAKIKVAPQIKILNLDSAMTYSWGTVSPKQTTLNTQLPIINLGTDTLHIKSVKPACGCTSAPLDKYSIAPGDTSILSISLRTTGYKGNVLKGIAIESDDPTDPELYFFIQANIVYPISFEPNEYLVFLNSVPNKIYNQKLVLKNTTDKDITITDISASSGEITYNLSVGTKISARSSVELRVNFKPTSAQNFHGTINFKTDCQDDDLFRVYIKGIPPTK